MYSWHSTKTFSRQHTTQYLLILIGLTTIILQRGLNPTSQPKEHQKKGCAATWIPPCSFRQVLATVAPPLRSSPAAAATTNRVRWACSYCDGCTAGYAHMVIFCTVMSLQRERGMTGVACCSCCLRHLGLHSISTALCRPCRRVHRGSLRRDELPAEEHPTTYGQTGLNFIRMTLIKRQ